MPTLTRVQLEQQINALEQLGASQGEIQEYINTASSSVIAPPRTQEEKRGAVERLATFGQATFGRLGDFMFGTIVPTVGSVIGAGAEAARGTPGPSTREADRRLGTPWPAALNILGSVLEATPAGIGRKFVQKAAEKTISPLTEAATRLYQSALKPGRAVVRKGAKTAAEELAAARNIAQIGIRERVWLTKGGVERVANRIDDFEDALGSEIEAAAALGKKVTFNRQKLQSYLNEARRMFRHLADTEMAERSLAEISTIQKNFIEKYGTEIPIDVAQEIKVQTGRVLRKYYGEMSGARQEAMKQTTRFLKEEIVEQAPKVGDINRRLSDLYRFDQALAAAGPRIRNLNLLGLGAKIGGAVTGGKGALVGKALDLLDAPAIKSGIAIMLGVTAEQLPKRLGQLRVPLAEAIAEVIEQGQE